MQTKVALIAGISSQDGARFAESLLYKGYEVHGITPRSSRGAVGATDPLFQNPDMDGRHFVVHHSDAAEPTALVQLVRLQPDEIYNLSLPSPWASEREPSAHWDAAIAADADGWEALQFLEAIRAGGMQKKTRFYQAGLCELYGLLRDAPHQESNSFVPANPYAAASLASFRTTVNYRQNHGIYACNGISFNSESPVRGESAVTRKITRAVARTSFGLQDCVRLRSLNAMRDWGRARDYMEMQWLMLQQAVADDFAIATGCQDSVRSFVCAAFATSGLLIEFEGIGVHEVGRVVEIVSDEVTRQVGDVVVRVDPSSFCASDLHARRTVPARGKQKLIWSSTPCFGEFVDEMMAADRAAARRDMRQKSSVAHGSGWRE
jgi:GDPmannose 4,6-dehydratase